MAPDNGKLTDAELAARAAEGERLKQEIARRPIVRAFTYRDYSRDMELLIDDLVKDEPANPLGIPLYYPASAFLLDHYYEQGALEPLAAMFSKHKRWSPGYFEPLFQRLEQDRRFDLIERVCTSIARNARALFFYHRIERDHGVSERVEQVKREVLEVYDKCIAWTSRAGRSAAADRLTRDREALRQERWPQLPPPSDRRKIDDAMFWELIGRSRAEARGTAEQVVVIGQSLKSFSGAGIKRFGAIYARLMKHLYHWNAWALAYAARGGCSDDAFEEFRTWLILRGDPALLELAMADPVAAAKRVPRDPDLPGGTLLPIIDEAYLGRCGATVALPRIDLAKPRGKEWREDEFEATFPELVQHYAA